jgi:hypothetical protein
VIKMSLMLIFNRKVIPIASGEKGQGKVECSIAGYVDGDAYEIGHVNFPTKQAWTKFWGAVQRGAIAVPDMEVKMFNVPLEGEEHGTPQPVSEDIRQEPNKRWVGNSLIEVAKDDPKET